MFINGIMWLCLVDVIVNILTFSIHFGTISRILPSLLFSFFFYQNNHYFILSLNTRIHLIIFIIDLINVITFILIIYLQIMFF